VSEPQYIAETLAWCNKQRREQGKKPLERLPKGHRNQSTSCPCGRATGLSVYADNAYATDRLGRDTGLPLRVSRAVTRFVLAFDRGRLPQYEAKR
jgi:hypothetical protein